MHTLHYLQLIRKERVLRHALEFLEALAARLHEAICGATRTARFNLRYAIKQIAIWHTDRLVRDTGIISTIVMSEPQLALGRDGWRLALISPPRQNRARQEILCHRCRKLRTKRGALSAPIENEAGERLRHYLCAYCCNDLREGHR